MDSAYQPFVSVAEWMVSLSGPVWDEYLASFKQAAAAVGEDDLRRARDIALRTAALETGAIEGLYNTHRGVTRSVALQGNLWESALDEIGPDVRGHFDAQLETFEMVMDFATGAAPITEAWIRSLHAQVCAGQHTYRVTTSVGVQEHQLMHGAYKTEPNDVALPGGGFHRYAAVSDVKPEMVRLVAEMNDESFATAHAITQTAYVHHALTAIHPFSDGNGRTARALASVFLQRAASIPLVIFSDQQEAYWDSLAAADAAQPEPFVRFIEQRALDTLAMMRDWLVDARSTLSDRSAGVRRLFSAHGGLSHEEIQQVARRLQDLLHAALNDLLHAANLPVDIAPSFAFDTGRISCDFGRKYHTLREGGLIRLHLDSQEPVVAHAETTPVIGIADQLREPFTFIVIDANRPASEPLRLGVSHLHPTLSASAEALIDGWARLSLGRAIDDFHRSLEGALKQAGY